MYCKLINIRMMMKQGMVLIVAKCIVNDENAQLIVGIYEVLIVAKCIVNLSQVDLNEIAGAVLIVAKCIVNIKKITKTC